MDRNLLILQKGLKELLLMASKEHLKPKFLSVTENNWEIRKIGVVTTLFEEK